MEKIEMGKFNFLYPLPVILLGAEVNGKANYAVLGNCGIMSMEPPVIYVSSDKSHYTNIGIREKQIFSVNIPNTKQVVEMDYCGCVSGNEVDKSVIFTQFTGNTGVPMIKECPVNLECKVIQTINIGNMEVFIGEVVNTFINDNCIKNGFPDMKMIDPIIYDIRNIYGNIGDWTERPFAIGKQFEIDRNK